MTNTESVSSTTSTSINLEEVGELAGEVLDALADTMPALLDGPLSDAAGTWLVGKVAFVGGPPAAEATIVTSTDLGARLAVAYGLVEEGGPQLEDAIDAFSEFVNVMGGSLKAAFEEVTTLGIPSVNVVEGVAPQGPEFVAVDHAVGSLSVSIVTG